MEKKPRSCGYSVRINGRPSIYICRLEVKPCDSCEICAKEKIDGFVKKMGELVNKERRTDEK